MPRFSRARRAFAAAVTFKKMSLFTPDALGFLEVSRGSLPLHSYLVCAYLGCGVRLDAWAGEDYVKASPSLKKEYRQWLVTDFCKLYEQGIYHRDTKASNMLRIYHEDVGMYHVCWIDMECVKFGVKPSCMRILRNLVQFNGSLYHCISGEERRAFVAEFADCYPWVNRSLASALIRYWTQWRIFREKIHLDGP